MSDLPNINPEITDNVEYPERYEEYFLNLPLWPEFGIYNSLNDGLIPSCRIDSWENFDEVVQHYCTNDVSGDYVFRGQKNYLWQLEPTLDRLNQGAITKEIATTQLINFKFATRGRLKEKSILHEDNELWALGQHHGLATPLLDWSASPFVAMFFAFEGEDDPSWVNNEGKSTNYSRTVFILNKQFLKDLTDDPEVNFSFPSIVEPTIDDHGRLVNQAGLFTIAPYKETLESSLINALRMSGINTDEVSELAKYICRIHIPNTKVARSNCLQKLRKMNIHHASLFPDLIGSSGYCNGLINDFIRTSKSNNKEESGHHNTPPTTGLSVNSWNLHKIDDDLLESLIGVLGLNSQVAKQVKPDQMSKVVKNLIQFVNEQAGIDWYKRESELARLRLKVRRDLKKQQYPDDWLDDAAEALIIKAAELSEDIEKLAYTREQVRVEGNK